MNINFLTKWIIFYTLGQFLGIGLATITTSIGGILLISANKILAYLFAIALMLLAGIFQGSIFSLFQWLALKTRYIKIRKFNWIRNTTIGTAISWVVFLVILNLITFLVNPRYNIYPETPFIILITIFMITGIVLGAFIGFVQWLELKNHSINSLYWILANALSWFIGMAIIMSSNALITYSSSPIEIILISLLFGLVGYFIVSLITGLFLVKIIQPINKETSN